MSQNILLTHKICWPKIFLDPKKLTLNRPTQHIFDPCFFDPTQVLTQHIFLNLKLVYPCNVGDPDFCPLLFIHNFFNSTLFDPIHLWPSNLFDPQNIIKILLTKIIWHDALKLCSGPFLPPNQAESLKQWRSNLCP